MRKGKMGGQNDISGKESHRLYQSVLRGDAGCHLPTCRKFLSKTNINMGFLSRHSMHNLPMHTTAVYH